MQKDVASMGVCTRRRGAAWFTWGSSSEKKQAAALSELVQAKALGHPRSSEGHGEKRLGVGNLLVCSVWHGVVRFGRNRQWTSSETERLEEELGQPRGVSK